jgi:hypothetical protein
MRALTPHDQPGSLGPAGEIDALGNLRDLAVLPIAAVLVKRRDPSRPLAPFIPGMSSPFVSIIRSRSALAF